MFHRLVEIVGLRCANPTYDIRKRARALAEPFMFASVAVHYLWWIVALALIAIEVIMPGYFMLWIGIGAAVTGLLALLIPGLPLLVQSMAFAVLAFVSCAVYWYGVRPKLQRDEPGEERLNRR